jgi:outer membrane protein
MKNTALIVWNVVLTLAVVFLLFQKFSAAGSGSTRAATDHKNYNDSANGSNEALRIAYVNIDTLQAHYGLYEEKKKELEKKQQQSEAQLNKMIDDFQNDYTAAQQAAATMTESQLQATQEKFQKKQAEIQQKQGALQSAFQSDLEQANRQLKDSLDSFIKRYNEDKKFSYVLSFTDGGDILFGQPRFDITDDAIKGMNAMIKK